MAERIPTEEVERPDPFSLGRRTAQCDRCLTYTEVDDAPGAGPGRFCDPCMADVDAVAHRLHEQAAQRAKRRAEAVQALRQCEESNTVRQGE